MHKNVFEATHVVVSTSKSFEQVIQAIETAFESATTPV